MAQRLLDEPASALCDTSSELSISDLTKAANMHVASQNRRRSQMSNRIRIETKLLKAELSGSLAVWVGVVAALAAWIAALYFR